MHYLGLGYDLCSKGFLTNVTVRYLEQSDKTHSSRN